MKKTFLGTILAVNIVLLLVAVHVLYKEASSPISGIKAKTGSVKNPKVSGKTVRKENKKNKAARRAKKKTDTAAYISINSVPSGAKVFINGYYKAKTPANIKLTSVSEVPRQYSIKLFKAGFYSWEKMVTLIRGSTKEFSVNLKKK
ncbi:MAG: PEGA domain-containing protein [Elusimicrobiota bacterium]|nr:PEGA domain-containing protein [Elusimicrobiota bacterium]